MAKRIPEYELRAIEMLVATHPGGIAVGEMLERLEEKLKKAVPRRTLQHRLGHLVSQGRLIKTGRRRGTRYLAAPPVLADSFAGSFVDSADPRKDGDPTATASSVMEPPAAAEAEGGADGDNVRPSATSRPETSSQPASSSKMSSLETSSLETVSPKVRLSEEAIQIRNYVRRPIHSRELVTYKREFLDGYGTRGGGWLSDTERAHLLQIATPPIVPHPAGTYARMVLDKLLIDLSWNSSRLEGNTYTRQDTSRLINFGATAEGKTPLEATMILNHGKAIEFLLTDMDQLGFNRHTILGLHAQLADNLMPDPNAVGRLRRVPVGIHGSVYQPTARALLIEECFDQILATADAIANPFEQALFAMVHLPYLQPFEDVNKRVSRLAANIPLIKENLTPLSFIDVPKKTYLEAIMGVYELNRVELLKEVFIWACECSAPRYQMVRQVIGEPDLFRFRHRSAMEEIVRIVMLERLDRLAALARIAAWTRENIKADDQEQFREMIENEVLNLHEGNFVRYRVSLSEFNEWQAVWNPPE